MKKLMAVVLCLVSLWGLCIPALATSDEIKPELEIDVNNRYTDISEMDEYDEIYIDIQTEEEEQQETKKMIYIVILCVLLVLAVIILIVSLKRVPPEDEEDDFGEATVEGSSVKKALGTSLAQEEKDDEIPDDERETATDDKTEEAGENV